MWVNFGVGNFFIVPFVHLALLFHFLFLDDPVYLLVAVILSLLAYVGRESAEELGSGFDENLSSCVHIQRGQEGHIVAL